MTVTTFVKEMIFTSNDTHTNSLKSKNIPTLFRLNNGISISKANSTKRARNRYRIRSLPVDFDLISHLTYEWVKRVQMEKIRVTNSMIRLASTEIARSKKMHGFKGSKGWIYRFKKIHLLLFDKSTIEGVSNRDLYFANNCKSLCATSSRILNEVIEEDNDYNFEPIDDYKSDESDSTKASSSSDYFEEDTDQVEIDISRNHKNFERVSESEMTYMFSRMRSYCEQSSPQLLPHLNKLENLFYDRD